MKLGFAQETHEVIFEPETMAIYVSQMTDSVLVKVEVDPATGLLKDEQTYWHIGEINNEFVYVDGERTNTTMHAGLHNVSLCYSRPGCLWLSLQYANTLLLVDVKNLENEAPKILYEYKAFDK